MGLFASLKTKKLCQISNKLDNRVLLSVDDLNNSHRDEVLDELSDLCEADSNVNQVMNTYRIGRENLKELYNRMYAVGMGVWTKDGHYVPASSIAYSATLDYLLRHEDDDNDNFREVASRVSSYFENGEMASFIN